MRVWLAAAMGLAMAACTPAAEPEAESFRAPAVGETRVEGRIEAVEDGGYPQFTVTIAPADGEKKSLYLNAEGGADLGGLTPDAFVGKPGVVYYTTVAKLDLVQLTADGKPLTEGVPAAGDPVVTGVLSGAEEATTSDLPDTITVTDASGKAFAFDYYVTPEIAAANGKTVVAAYEAGALDEVTLMRSVEP